jgi:hypothetical protein
MMRNAKAAKALAAAAVAASAGLAAPPASAATHITTGTPQGFVPRPATATPDTTGRCSPVANSAKVCGHIHGFGSYISYLTISACIYGTGQWVHGEIISPSGGYNNTASYYRSGGNCVSPMKNIAFNHCAVAGPWRFVLWRKNPGGGWANINHVSAMVDGASSPGVSPCIGPIQVLSPNMP